MITAADYDAVKKHITPILINSAIKKAVPDNIITIKFLDLYIAFSLMPCSCAEGHEDSLVYVTGELLNSFQLSADPLISRIKLLNDAIANEEKRHPAVIRLLTDILELSDELPDTADPGFYVLSNTSMEYGACTMLYPEVLSEFASQINESFNIIPSSVHEVLLIPDSFGLKISELRKLLLDVNAHVLRRDEILSGNIYRYDPSQGLFLVQSYEYSVNKRTL